MSRFVRPDTIVLTISQGDTLTVKRRLNSGEERELFSRMYLAGVDGSLKANPFQTGVALIMAYLLDWTLKDDSGTVRRISGVSLDELTRALDELDPSSYAEIRQSIEAHDNAVRVQREQEKNERDGATTLPAISPSPSVAAGVMSGSVN